MRIFLAAVAVAALVGCGIGGTKGKTQSTSQPISCDPGEAPIYTNRFAPSAGASGVASYPAAAAGEVSQDTGSMATTPPVPSDPGGPATAMVVSCGDSTCGTGLVGVEIPPAPTNGGTGIGSAPVGAPAGADPAPTPTPDPTPAPAPTIVCAVPPPSCATGLSPQYTAHGTWECTDCSLVITYGGIYGNYRRCVNAPTVVCPSGQVPTWSYDKEDWECDPTCDNGMYDQHTINGQLVCVPC
jgi:hypothetical protein